MDILKRPDTLSLAGNLNRIVVYTTAELLFTMRYSGGDAIVENTYTPNDQNRVEVDIKSIVIPLLTFDLRNSSTPYQQTKIARAFTVELSEVVGGTAKNTQTISFTALRAGVDELSDAVENFLQQNFLTWQPNIKPVTYYSPEFLTYYAVTTANMKCRATMEDGSTQDLTLASIPAGQCWTVPVQYAVIAGKASKLPAYYDVWMENQSGQRLTYIQRYYADDMRSQVEEWILFENSLGGVDTFRAYGDSDNTAEHTHNIVEIDEKQQEYRVDTERKHTKNTGHLDIKERTWLLDFFPSLGKYIYTDQHLREIVVTESDVNYKAKTLPSSYTFTYRYASVHPYLNLPRTDTPQEVLELKVPDVASFTIAPRLVEFPRQVLSRGALFPIQDPYSEGWGTTTVVAMAEWFVRFIEEMYDGSGGIGHRHVNLSLLNSLNKDGDDYLLLDEEKIKAGYADEAGLAYDLVDSSVLNGKFLSKVNPDTAQGLITFLAGLIAVGRISAQEGIHIGNFIAGFIGGSGGSIDKEGNGELESLRIRQFLEVPELRFNRIDVVSGELWNSICFGTIESVDVKKRIAVLKLQDGELSGIKAGDICRGIFHCLEAENPSESIVDDCGFLQLAGFSTSYFTPTEVYDNGASFKYSLRQGTSVHPQVGMKFAVYGSFTDKSRRASAYMTRTYTRYLNNVDTWQIRPDVHIYGQQGDIEGLTINGVEMHGYGAYLHNLYLSGVHIEFDRDWIDHNMPKTYNVVLTTYERTVVTDIEGNPLTGLEEIRNIISEDGNVVSGESNVIANRLALTTTIQASKGSTPLLYSDIMDEGKFVVSLQCIGCTAKCENGVVMVTSLDMESMEHQVVIEVNCEGEAVYQQIFNVPVVKQGENGVTADLDNEMATIAANDKGKPIVEPFEEIVSHGRLWYGNDEMYLVKAEVAVPGGITVADVTTVTDEEGQHNYLPIVDNKYCTLRITNVGEDAADISQIRIEMFGRIKEQMNTEYSKVVVFTLNKVRMGENAQNYSLLTTSPIMQADGKGNVTTTQVACSVLASDGKSMTELTTAEELTEHTLTMKVQLYNANDAASEEVAYTIGTNLVVGTSTIGGLKLAKDSVRLVFSLYWQGLLIDKEGIPMIKDGSSTVRIDLDNENDSILYNDAGEKVSSDCYTNIKVYDGSKNVTSSCILSIDYGSYVSAYISGTQCYVTSVSSTTGYARIAAYYPADGNTYYAIFSIKRLVGEDKYEIVTSPTTVSYDPNKKEYSATSVKVDVYRTDQNGVRSIISSSNTLPSGYALQYSSDGSVWAAISAGSSVTPDYTLPNIFLRIVDNNGKVRDSETVPVVIGGSDSTSYWLISPVSAFSLSPSGSYTPSSFSVTMKKKTGEDEVDNCSDFYLSVWGVLSGGGVEYISRNSEKSHSITVTQPSSDKTYTSLLVVASSDVPSSNNYPSKIVAEMGIGIVTDGKAGDAGNSIFLIDKGVFKPGQPYKFDKMEGVDNAYERDWVLHNPGGGSYYAYAVKSMGTTDLQTAPSIAGASDSNWEFLNKHESVLADTLIGVNCNIGGFAVTNEQFASQNYLTNDAGICINGKNGEIIAKQSSTSEWKVDNSGNMSIGNPSGQRIVVNPETRDIKVFDSSDNLVTTISGETVSSISNLFGSAGSISAVSSAVGFTIRGTGTIQTKKEYITLSNEVYADAGAKLSASCSLYLSASLYTDSGDTSKPQIMGNSISARIVYTDYYNVVYGAITGSFSVVGDVMSGGAGSNTLRGSAIVKSSGYYYVKLEVKYAVGAASLNLVAISNIENIGLSLVVNNYLSRLLANGFCFGSTNANYIAALNESDGNMHFDYKAGTTQLELTNSNFVLKSQYGKVFPTILWVYCSYSAISSYFTATGIKPTFTKSSTGSYVIDYSACNLGTLYASNTILSVTSVYGEYRAIQIGNISTGKFPILSFDKSGNAADTYFILQVQRII